MQFSIRLAGLGSLPRQCFNFDCVDRPVGIFTFTKSVTCKYKARVNSNTSCPTVEHRRIWQRKRPIKKMMGCIPPLVGGDRGARSAYMPWGSRPRFAVGCPLTNCNCLSPFCRLTCFLQKWARPSYKQPTPLSRPCRATKFCRTRLELDHCSRISFPASFRDIGIGRSFLTMGKPVFLETTYIQRP
jgi:hypothetical protein